MRLNAASIVNDARSEAKNFMGRNFKNMGASEFTVHAGQHHSRNSGFTSKRNSAAPHLHGSNRKTSNEGIELWPTFGKQLGISNEPIFEKVEKPFGDYNLHLQNLKHQRHEDWRAK
jgi:hypothetical protein